MKLKCEKPHVNYLAENFTESRYNLLCNDTNPLTRLVDMYNYSSMYTCMTYTDIHADILKRKYLN